MKSEKGFTLIELLAVIVIMGILMAIAIPSINLIITDARKDIYVNSARTFINEAEKEVVNSTFEIDDPDTTYYIHIANLVDDVTNLGKSGFATWSDSYVVATMALVNNKVDTNYYFNGSDMANWKIELVGRDNLKKSDVYQDNNRKVNFYPVGNRSKIVVYDANGIKITDKKPYISLDEEKASKCYTYQDLSGTTVSITGYKPICGMDVVIPSAIAGKEVREIGTRAFQNKNIKSVYVPDTVTMIGRVAFISTGLTSVTLSEGLKVIDYAAFYDNKLTEVRIPSTVESIGAQAFFKNSIEKLTLDKSLKTISIEAFRYNRLRDSVEKLVPGPNTTIGKYAFSNNLMASGDLFTYARNSDGSVDYSTITGYMGELEEFSNKTFVIPRAKNGVALKKIVEGAFREMDMLDGWGVVIPDSVTDIGQTAFISTKIASVKLPSGIKKINYATFYNNKLTEVVIPNGVEVIGTQAFSQNKIAKLSMTASVKTIEREAFRYNELTDSVNKLVPNPNATIGKNAFSDNKIAANDSFIYNKNSDGTIDYTMIVGYSGDLSEFSNKTFVIPGTKEGVTLTTIKERAFSEMTILDSWSVVIPDSVTNIGQAAFISAKIAAVKLPSKIKTIPYAAFYNNKLTEVVIPSGVETIKTQAFSQNKISKLSLPSSVKTIEREAFRYNELVEGVNKLVPNYATTIGKYAFNNNKIPADQAFVYKKNSNGAIDYSTIVGYTGNLDEFSNKTFTIPGSKNGVNLTTIGERAFSEMDILKGYSIVIPDSVTNIGQLAFISVGISSVKLSSNLKTIPYATFYNNNLTEVIVPSSVTSIGGQAFSGNPKLIKIVNKTGKSFDWKTILGGAETATFETGIVKTNNGNINITKE